jgi:hypothetical protein
MKNTLAVIAFLLSGLLATAQQKTTDLDKSPMDMSYFPANYPILKMNGKAKADPYARIVYSRPLKNNRLIFGGIVKYGELWRLGANESTELEVYKNIRIGGKTISKGKYTIYCIPYENKWTIIINKDIFSWGSFTYNAKKDVVRVDVPVQLTDDPAEALTMYFEDNATGANLVMMWDNVKTVLPVTL